MPESRRRTLRFREASEGMAKLLRKARRDAWDDAIADAQSRGMLTSTAADEEKARNPYKGCFS